MRAACLLPALLLACGNTSSPVTGGGSGGGGGPPIGGSGDAGTPPDAGQPDAGAPDAGPAKFGLNIGINGSGTVQSNPSGIDCGSACAAIFDEGTAVPLSATPAAAFRFDGWAGACSGPGACTAFIRPPG